MLDLELLRSPSFLLLAFGGGKEIKQKHNATKHVGFLTMCGFFVPFMYVSRAAEASGIEESSARFLVSIIGIVNIVSRVMCGCVSLRTITRHCEFISLQLAERSSESKRAHRAQCGGNSGWSRHDRRAFLQLLLDVRRLLRVFRHRHWLFISHVLVDFVTNFQHALARCAPLYALNCLVSRSSQVPTAFSCCSWALLHSLVRLLRV